MDSTNNAVVKSAKRALETAASLAGSAMVARSLIREFLPPEISKWIFSCVNILLSRQPSTEHTVIVEQTEGFSKNQFYEAVSTYLATRINTSTKKLRVSKVDSHRKKGFTLSLEPGERIFDAFEGALFKWRLVCHGGNTSGEGDGNRNAAAMASAYELSFDSKYQDMVLSSYLPYIQDRAEAIKAENRTLKIYTTYGESWTPIDLHHPATFDTLAMDLELKKAVMDGLDRFVERKDYYKKIGKAWKRGYLLYGPPGTGKTSMIAAMANYLKFDIYDLDLARVRCNGDLRRLLVRTANRSIIVVEDIDCSVEIKRDVSKMPSGKSGVDEKVTLSGLLNFVDGLWSSCGEERIIVFTTNFKDRLDPALLRPGRMDVHIYMGYCSAFGFRVLASNYHGIDDHPLFEDIEGLIKEVEVTPAEVAEKLMSDDKETALRGLCDFLREKKGDSDDQYFLRDRKRRKTR